MNIPPQSVRFHRDYSVRMRKQLQITLLSNSHAEYKSVKEPKVVPEVLFVPIKMILSYKSHTINTKDDESVHDERTGR